MSSDLSNAKSTAPAGTSPPPPDMINIDLRDRWLAAFLAWLVPGAGHLYQRRWGKGCLFMVCILGTFLYGIFLGSNRVVYASFRANDGRTSFQDDARYAYLCQVAAGLPALPALIQANRTRGESPKAPLWNGFMAPPVLVGQRVPTAWANDQLQTNRADFQPDDFLEDGPDFMRYRRRQAQQGVDYNGELNQLSQWHLRFGALYELGTVFTMIAGLLNVLAIYDAWGGPMFAEIKEDDEESGSEAKP